MGNANGAGVGLAVPPLVGVYGNQNTGKTADQIWACGSNAIYFAGPGALVPAMTVVGWEPPMSSVEVVDPLTGDLDVLRRVVAKRIKAREKFRAVVIDDFSRVAHRTTRLMEPKYKHGIQLYGAFRNKCGDIFDEWRSYGLIVVVNCHVITPEYETNEEGKLTQKLLSKGMPDLPGKKAGPDMLKEWDIFYRVDSDPMAARGTWPYAYRGGPWNGGLDVWETKDRWNTVPQTGILPMNLGEILRTSLGLDMPRPKSLEWAEESVEWATGQVLGGSVNADMLYGDMARQMLGKKVPSWAIGWVIRDVRARVELKKLKTDSARLAQYGVYV